MDIDDFVNFVRKTFDEPEKQVILHDPRFIGNERKYLIDAMDSNFVSSVGEYVGKFEKAVAEYTGVKYAVAAVNGTSALHISLLLAGVEKDEEVIYNVRPGITGIGSIVFRDEERFLSQPGVDPILFYTEKIAPYKGELEIWYQQHASLLLDFKLIFLTAWVILSPESDLPFRWLKGLPELPEYLK